MAFAKPREPKIRISAIEKMAQIAVVECDINFVATALKASMTVRTMPIRNADGTFRELDCQAVKILAKDVFPFLIDLENAILNKDE